MPSPQGVPPGKMKVTVNLDEEIVKAAKKAAIDRREKTTLGELIEEALSKLLGLKGATRKR